MPSGKKKQRKENRKGKDHERFYLLPGQGGINFHRKQRVILTWSVIVAVLLSGLLGVVMWWYSKPRL